jgi:hypothetical protein
MNENESLEVFLELTMKIYACLTNKDEIKSSFYLGLLYAALIERREYLEIDKCKLPTSLRHDRVPKNYVGE